MPGFTGPTLIERPTLEMYLRMKSACLIITMTMFSCLAGRAEDHGALENDLVTWRWELTNGKLTSVLSARDENSAIDLTSDCFQVVLGDGRCLKPADFKLVNPARTEALPVEPDSPTLSRHFAGKQLVREFSDETDHLAATWNASLREGSSYLRESLTLRAVGKDVLVKEIVLFDQQIPGAKTGGTVDGSPVVAGTFFCGCEHPMARNTAAAVGQVECRLARNAVLKEGEGLIESLVLGLARPGQMRRSFLAYLERERTHPYRPFLHYNSWFDIAWDKQKFNEAQSLNVIEEFGSQLAQAFGPIFVPANLPFLRRLYTKLRRTRSMSSLWRQATSDWDPPK